MKKRFLGMLLGVLAMTALSACSGGTSQVTEDKPESTAQESVSEEAGTDAGSGSDATGTDTGDGAVTEKSGNEPVYGGSVVIGVQQDIDSLDPHKATAAGTKEILFNIFEGLVKPDENGNLINAVADGYTLSDDGYVYTFSLRDNVKFHNGNVVTAEDVKYSLERASGLLDGTALIPALAVITEVSVADGGDSVVVKINDPNPELIYSFTAAIIPEGSGESEGSDPIGTGPFAFESYKPQQGIILKKNPDYWQEGLPYLDEVNFKIVEDPDSALLEMKGGTIDIYAYLTDSQASEIKDIYNVEYRPSNVVQGLFLNNAKAPFDNKLVRQAVCYALDADEVNQFVAGGTGTPVASAMLPTLTDYYEDLTGVYGVNANVEKAVTLLAEAGYPDGIEFTIDVPSNYEFHMQTAEVVAEQMKKAGINAKVNPVEWNTWLSDVYTDRNYQATISGFTTDMTPSYLMDRFKTDSPKNFINYSSEAFDDEFAAKQAETTLAGRAEHYKKLQEIMAEDAASAFIQVGPVTTALAKDIAGYRFYPVYVQDMSTVYRR